MIPIKKWLALLSVLHLTACAGLSFDDIFNPNIEQTPAQLQQQKEESKKEQLATTLPERSENAVSVVASKLPAFSAIVCLEKELSSQFKLPDNFYGIKYYPDGSGTVRLVNPYSNKQGLYFDVAPQDEGSEIRLYPNFSTISEAWKKLPQGCQ